MRLDSYLAFHHFCDSRNKAKELILAGCVLVDGKPMTKPAFDVGMQSVTLRENFTQYVGRGAEKLRSFLEAYPLEIEGKRCLDVGSSTGGFTEILLQEGALSVTCVDVGEQQLHPKIRAHPNVEVHENTDIRAFRSETPFDIVTGDVSFVSLLHLLPALHNHARDIILLLFKPQFEVGTRVSRNKKGVVTDIEAVEEAKKAFLHHCGALGWRLLHDRLSEITGKEGNQEHFFCFGKK